MKFLWWCLVYILAVFSALLIAAWLSSRPAHANTVQATATATVVPYGHDPADLAQIASLKHAVNSMLQQGCKP